ncbi:SDR family oxidoreductase [Chitinophaga sp. MM2321]|uniref:SDR family NAD(P)-dependent oxidoreductase n=1 Tax=Chitinophaga sp. MM2321 TaxID=3137178 RepID=UPI0032D5A96D
MNRKRALITGAASGIGKAAALRFASEGYDVCINDIQKEKLSLLLHELPPGNHLSLCGSYAEQETVKEGERIIRENWGSLDVLINCAGLFEKTNPITMEIGQWRNIFDCMINGCLLITQLAEKFMTNGGRIVHVSSIHGTRAERQASSYSMAKAAINQYCRSMALELADKNILVNAIAPGFVNTGMSVVDGQNELDSQWFKDNYVQGDHLPLRRAANPDEIAGVAFFLAGKDASYITGQVITVDGGLTITF